MINHPKIKFERISVDQGLSQSSVFSIYQDRKGFLWFGTLEGLNKYDGYNFILYKANPSLPNSLSSSTIFSIYEDKHSGLWIGTLGGGLNKYNRNHDDFTRYLNKPGNSESLSDNNIRAIFEDSKGRLWVGTNNGLNILDRKTGKFRRFFNNPNAPGSLSNNYIWSIFEDSDKNIWIGTYGGLNKYIEKDDKFMCFTYNKANKNGISNNYVWSIFEDHKHRFWIGTDNGLNLFDRHRNIFTSYVNNQNNPTSIGQNKIWKIFEDSKNTLWIGTLGGGLNRLVESPGNKFSFIKYQNSAFDPYSISHNYIWSVFEDRSGILWIGTDIGINKYESRKEKFRLYKNDPFNINSLNNNEVTSTCIDKNNIVWIGTRNGLNKFDPVNNSFRNYKVNVKDPNSLSTNYIRCIYEDRSGRLWVGTNGGGLNEFDRKKNIFIRYKAAEEHKNISDNNVTAVYQDKKGILWIGTLAGLNKYDIKNNTFRHYTSAQSDPYSISHDYIYCISEDKYDRLWIGTLGGGLNCFDKTLEKFYHYQCSSGNPNSLSNNYVWAIFDDSHGASDILWIGTNDGLNRFDTKRNKFTIYREKEGLPNAAIYGILKDDRNNLWLSTNRGITKFSLDNNKFKNYTLGDGLQGNQYTGGAFCKSSRGEMFFGGINGLNSFYPDSVKENNYIPPIVFTDFLIFNKSVKPGKDSPLSRSITETSEIKLSYEQSVFSFEFAALHYSNPSVNQYAYKLEGFDKLWNYSKTRRFVTYTNLDPGTYWFHVIGSNNDGVWNKKGVSIKIIIMPPFWKTWWFIVLAVLLFSAVIWSIVAFRMHHLLDIERLRLKIAADLHDDIGTRLTEISMLSDMVFHTFDTAVDKKESIKKIGGIARNLINNMSDIIWLINPQRDSLYELFLKLRDSYEEIFSHSQILLHINNLKYLEKIKLPMEYRRHLYLIFKEALNNSLKYARCTEISINTQITGRILDISLYDNGIGYDSTKKYKGNGLNNMKTRAEEINGILRIQSKPGEGTMVKFTGKY